MKRSTAADRFRAGAKGDDIVALKPGEPVPNPIALARAALEAAEAKARLAKQKTKRSA